VPRKDQLYAAAERNHLRQTFAGARTVLVTTQIAPHERNDRPGRECPCCGSTSAWGLGKFDDLSILVDAVSGLRRNRWELSAPGVESFDEMASMAEPWGQPDATTWHVPIVFRCREDQIDALCDDVSETILFSGGWRSGKTYLVDQWWIRGWVKLGGRDRKFWLLAPLGKQAFNNMRKIFHGREGDPSIVPKYNEKPVLAYDFPNKHTDASLTFTFIDKSRGELYAVGKTDGANLEGDEVMRIGYDEAARVRTSGAYEVSRGRVMQSSGQVGLSTVPHDDAPWIYDEIVKEFEEHGDNPDYHERRVVTCSTRDNVFIPPENIERLYAGTKDPKVVSEKLDGRWNRRGLYAYVDVWEEDEFVRDIRSHEPAAWGFEHDVTAQVARAGWGLSADELVPYIGGGDANWHPMTNLMARVFGNRNKPETWTLVFLDEQLIEGDAEEAAQSLAERDRGRYKGSAICCDASMFWDSHAHGGRANKTNDARMFKRFGFHVRPPILAGGESNPDVIESRKPVRMMMRDSRILVSSFGCPGLANAIPRVPNRVKLKRDSGAAIDRTVYNFEDCMRYPVWRCFSKILLPKRQGLRIHSGLTPTSNATRPQ
jgi:hypothetical protein